MKAVKLYAPEQFGNQPCCYHDAPLVLRNAVAGGCGPGGLGDYIVPDTLYGLSVKPACAIHDWQYHYGVTLADKDDADNNFRDNMVRLIKAQGSWGIIENLRLRRARTYYEMVSHFGGPAFWAGKSSIYELREVGALQAA
jgi:hypothetical protein